MKTNQLCLLLLFACTAGIPPGIPPAPGSRVSAEDAGGTPAVQKAIKDYIDLYAKDTLVQWKELFHPSAMIMFPADDGTITTRNVEEFYERQRNFFATGKSISERLENLQIAEGRRIARVLSDFVFVTDGAEKRGKLGLHLVEGKDGWKIVGLVFSYNDGPK